MAHLAPQLYLSPGSAILAARVRGHALPWGTHRTRGERARSQAECQSDRYHYEGAGERRLGRHQEDDAQQQGGYGQQRCQENGSWVRCSSDWGSGPAGASRASRSMARLRGSMSAARAILS